MLIANMLKTFFIYEIFENNNDETTGVLFIYKEWLVCVEIIYHASDSLGAAFSSPSLVSVASSGGSTGVKDSLLLEGAFVSIVG